MHGKRRQIDCRCVDHGARACFRWDDHKGSVEVVGLVIMCGFGHGAFAGVEVFEGGAAAKLSGLICDWKLE